METSKRPQEKISKINEQKEKYTIKKKNKTSQRK